MAIAETVQEMNAASEAAVDALENDIVEVVEVVRNNPKMLAAVGVLGLIAGGVGGYFIAKRQLKAHFEQVVSEEIADAKEFYAGLNKTDEDGAVLTPQDVLRRRHGAEAVAAVREYQGRPDDEIEEPVLEGEPHDDIVDEEHIQKMERHLKAEKPAATEEELVEKPKPHNMFVDDTFDLEEELKYRTEDKPYIITHDEFYEAEKDYDTQSLTYYSVDDTLTDEHDKPLENTDELVGDDHLVRFGSGSKDKNIVYVRNDALQVDYEIARDKGSYLESVLGMTEEEPNTLKHSDQRDRRRAFRHGDE